MAGAANRCVIPEYKFNMDRLAELLMYDRARNPSKYAICLVSEGSMYQGGEMVFQSSTTDAFGRHIKRPLSAPFHAVKVTGSLFHTQGGLDIDAQCRVLREDGTPLPNLLAAGGAARGVSGNEVWGYLTGNGLLSAVGGGWLAGETVAEMLVAAQAA
jgi:predicted oxidoreductase